MSQQVRLVRDSETQELLQRSAPGKQNIESLCSGRVANATDDDVRVVDLRRSMTDSKAAYAVQARLAAIVESSPDAIIRVDANGIVEDWNPSAARLYGYSAREVIGHRTDFLEPPSRQGECATILGHVRRGNGVVELETVRRHKNGIDVDVSLTVCPIRDQHGHIVGFSKTARDISDRKRAEQRFRDLLDSAPDAMFLVDEAGAIRLVNRQLEALFGYPREELTGKRYDVLIPMQSGIVRRPERKRHRTAGDARTEAPRQVTARRRDGSEFDAEITLSPIRGAEGTSHTMVAVRDVTELNKMRSQLMISDRMASIGIMAAGIAHEINNPLASIIANLGLALQDFDSCCHDSGRIRDVGDQLKDARDAAERVRLIVQDLKMFSRSEGENLQAVDVKRVMESTLRLGWNEIRHRARLVKDYGRVPPVCASEARLGQIFLNLLVNAAQAIPEGRADSNEIRVTTSMSPDGRVVVAISDTGSGMSPEVQKRLFTPFFTTKPAGQGTGLGLSISQRLVNNFGGHIEVESKLGSGTVFRVFLPAASKDGAAEGAREVILPARRRGRVLLVDDEQTIGRVVGRIVGREHDVTVLTSAEEALALSRSGERFDVILCDLMMPQMTGMDLYAELLQTVPDQAARMIFLTGGAFTPQAQGFLEATPNSRLEKPFDFQQLRSLINERIE